MSLLDDLKALKPEGYDTHYDYADKLNCEIVQEEIIGSTRWGYIREEIFSRDGEFVAVSYEVASGDGECDYDPSFQEVEPVQTTTYRKKS